MELRSQELRKIAPELDPLRLGTGWKVEDLSKPQIMIESTFGDSHPDIFWNWWKRPEKESQRQAAMGPDTLQQISVTEKLRDMMVLITLWLPEI